MKNNPAESYFTSLADQARGLEEAYQDPEPMTRKPKPEAKTRRVQLLIRPSLYRTIQQQADREGMSVNSYMNKLLEEGVKLN